MAQGSEGAQDAEPVLELPQEKKSHRRPEQPERPGQLDQGGSTRERVISRVQTPHLRRLAQRVRASNTARRESSSNIQC